MNDIVKTKTVAVDIQENGIIRHNGFLIGRLVNGIDFSSRFSESGVSQKIVANVKIQFGVYVGDEKEAKKFIEEIFEDVNYIHSTDVKILDETIYGEGFSD